MIDSSVAEHILLHCDRTRSKEARYSLDRFLWEPLKWQQMRLSPECLLAPQNDILRAQEAQKLLMPDGLWKCSLCGKIFRSEHYHDKHLARKHSNMRYDTGTSCLADFCGTLVPCAPLTPHALPSVSTILLLRQDKGLSPSDEIRGKEHCSNQRIQRNRVHACEEAIRRCLPDHVSFHTGFSSHGKLSGFREDLCERAVEIDCVPREEVWSHFGSLERALQRRHRYQYAKYVGLMATLLVIFAVVFWRRPNYQRLSDRRRKSR